MERIFPDPSHPCKVTLANRCERFLECFDERENPGTGVSEFREQLDPRHDHRSDFCEDRLVIDGVAVVIRSDNTPQLALLPAEAGFLEARIESGKRGIDRASQFGRL